MSDPREILKKADALLGRYGRGARLKQEPDFPVLTEVVESPVASTARESREPSAEVPVFAEARWRELEARISAQVWHAIESHLREVVAETLRERLDDCLASAVASLAVQIKSDVEEMVQAAVAEAIERARDERREPGSPSSA